MGSLPRSVRSKGRGRREPGATPGLRGPSSPPERPTAPLTPQHPRGRHQASSVVNSGPEVSGPPPGRMPRMLPRRLLRQRLASSVQEAQKARTPLPARAIAVSWAQSSRGTSRRRPSGRRHRRRRRSGERSVQPSRRPASAAHAPRSPELREASRCPVAGVRLLVLPHRAPCNISSSTEQGCHRGYRLVLHVLCGHHFGADGYAD